MRSGDMFHRQMAERDFWDGTTGIRFFATIVLLLLILWKVW